MPPLECPNCRLLNVETATRCDCGFDFAANRRPGRHVPFLSLPNVRTGLVLAAGGIAGVVFIEPPVRILCIWATVAGLGLLARGVALRRRTPLGEQPGEDWPITGLTFDSTGWRLRDATMDRMSWERANADTLSLTRGPHSAPPDPLTIDAIRWTYRNRAWEAGGGIVSVDTAISDGVPLIVAIFKFERSLGNDFAGLITVYASDATFEIRMDARESGVTGIREAIVGAALAESGELELPESSGPQPVPITGWREDPYNLDVPGPVLRSVSDDAAIDCIIPDHPLSRLRSGLAAVSKSLILHQPGMPARPDAWPVTTPAIRLLPAATAGCLLFKTGNYERAEGELREAIRTRTEWTSEQAGVLLMLLGLAQESQQKFVEAEAAFARSLDVFRRVSGESAISTARAMTNLGRARIALQKFDEAEPLLTQAMITFDANEARPTDVALAQNGLGLVRNAQHRYGDAVPHFARALELFEREHGEDFADRQTVLRNLAAAYRGLGDAARLRDIEKRLQKPSPPGRDPLAGRVIPAVSRAATPLPTFERRTGRLRGRRLRARSGRGPVATTR